MVGTNEKILAMKLAKKVRPSKRFSTGSSLEFANVMAKFDLATDNPALDSRTKLLELEHYLDGPPATIVNAYISHEDADEALAKARSEIEFLHGKSSDSMAPLLERMTKGKQLGVNDLNGHIRLYADLRNAYTIAANSGREADFSFETIRKLVRSRLDHLSTAYFTKDQKHMTKHQSHLHFEDLLSFIGQWVMVLTSKGNPQEGSTSRVAALGAEVGVAGEAPGPFQSPQEPPQGAPQRPPPHVVCQGR